MMYKVGDKGPAGGIIFCDKGVYSNGWRYLEAAPEDLSYKSVWAPRAHTRIATSTEIGSGRANTNTIIAAFGTGNYAAILCTNLRTGGYDDWFLPSKDELELMHWNLVREGLGGFSLKNDDYWSSSQSDSDNYAWYVIMADGIKGGAAESNPCAVRACRAF